MVVRVQVVVSDGEAIVTKRGDAADVDRLRREGHRLAAVAHPGVVALRHSGPAPGGWELHTAHSGPSLSAVGPLRPDQVARVGATVAATLAALHDRGFVHGRLDVLHILWGGPGGAVLCGVGPGPAGGGLAPPTTADDVAALGRVLRELLDQAEPTPRDAARDAVLALAGEATDPEPTRRPTAHRMAARLEEIVSWPVPRRAVARLVVVGAAAVGALIVAVLIVPSAPTAADREGSSVTSTSAGAAERPRCVAVAGVPVLAPPCPYAAEVTGRAVVIDGQRTTIGHPGDELAVGDWDCDGQPTPVLLRPSTGEVLELGPLTPGGPLAVVRAERVADATRLAVDAVGEGCAGLAVARSDGVVVALRLAGAAAGSRPTS